MIQVQICYCINAQSSWRICSRESRGEMEIYFYFCGDTKSEANNNLLLIVDHMNHKEEAPLPTRLYNLFQPMFVST